MPGAAGAGRRWWQVGRGGGGGGAGGWWWWQVLLLASNIVCVPQSCCYVPYSAMPAMLLPCHEMSHVVRRA